MYLLISGFMAHPDWERGPEIVKPSLQFNADTFI
jgi:hypothetical protein